LLNIEDSINCEVFISSYPAVAKWSTF